MKKRFSWRAFISFGLTYTIIILLVSGTILYVSPPGRYAHWVNWKIWGLTKEGWQALHTVFSYTFVILSIFHLFTVNWKVFLSYLKSKAQNGISRKVELLLSSILFLLFFAGIIYSIQPFKSVMDLSTYFTDSWEKTEETPPVPHAELLTLTELAEQMKLQSVDEIVTKLNNHGIAFETINKQTLKDIAAKNNTTPMEIYNHIRQTSDGPRPGSGIGKKTIETFAAEIGKNPEEVLQILKDNNIDAEIGQTLKEIGENNNMAPRDIYDLIKK